ncbi:MAG: sulfur carrier protein [Desulfovibrionaceae bacterium]|nr:MAG: sulfur carrier protein [Desulfovibrionaceae bacterium]
MSVTVNCFATLARFAPPDADMPAAAGLSVGQTIDLLGIPRPNVKTVFVNGLHATMDKVLSEGDRVGIFPAVAGG